MMRSKHTTFSPLMLTKEQRTELARQVQDLRDKLRMANEAQFLDGRGKWNYGRKERTA